MEPFASGTSPCLACTKARGLETPDAIALYAPALVGAFEFSTAWIEFFQ